MKKVLVRIERALIRAAVSPALRPAEHEIALALARSVLVRVGASGAIVALVVELIDRTVS